MAACEGCFNRKKAARKLKQKGRWQAKSRFFEVNCACQAYQPRYVEVAVQMEGASDPVQED